MDPQTPPLPHRLLDALENAAGLDTVVETLEPVAGRLVADATVRDALQGRKAGHAIHPALTDLPIGAWTSAALLDIFGGQSARDAARLLTGFGVLSALPTAITGWAEWTTGDRRAKRVGVIHAAAVGSAAALQAASYVARRRGRWGLGVVLGGLATAGVSVGGYLGAHLSIGLKVGSTEFPPQGSAPST